MADHDYAGWVARALAFTRRVAALPGVDVRSGLAHPPLDGRSLDRVAADVGRAVPAALRRFLETGSGHVDCAYVYEPDGEALDRLRAVLPDETRVYGGARLGPASELPDYARSAAEWARDTWVSEEPAQRALWEGALPFARIENGDYLALDLRAPGTDPPVLYLSHDDESFALAPRFTAFLGAWQRLCYPGAERWLLGEFRGAGGYLDADGDRAAGLRQLLGGGGS